MAKLSRRDAVLEIARVLAPRAAALRARIELAFDDPRRYLTRHRKDCHARSIDEDDGPRRELPWLALVDGLRAARACAEIDWKTDADDLAWSLARLRATPKGALAFLARARSVAERSTWELLELSGQQLVAHGLSLGQLDIASDSYPLVVLAAADVARVRTLARTAGFGTLDTFGKRLAAATRQRRAAAKKAEREARRNAAHAARLQHSWQLLQRGDGPDREHWSINVAPRGCSVGYEGAHAKHHEFHVFGRAGRSAAFARAEIAARRREGFRKCKNMVELHDSAYIGWVGPLPEGARYFKEGAKLVNALEQRGTLLWRTRSALGRNFGELLHIVHHDSEDEAARALAGAIYEQQAMGHRELTHAQVLRCYARRQPAR